MDATERLAELNGPPQRWLTISSAARYADLSENSIRRMISAGKLDAHRVVRGRILIDRQQLDAHIASTAGKQIRNGRGCALQQAD